MIYEVIRRDKIEELALAINSYLNAGWELAGGISGVHCSADDSWPAEFIWCQAVVKRHPAEPYSP